MSTILNHPRFKNDYDNFKSKIESIENSIDKIEAEKLLRDLVLHVKKLDSMHLEMSYTHTLSSIGNELRENIKEARIKLDKKLKECVR